MDRRCVRYLIVLFVAAWFGATFSRNASAADRMTVDDIRAALHVTAHEDGGFIARVLTKVERGELRRDTLHKAFLWARSQPNNKFQYFKRGLQTLAAREGVRL